MKYEMLSNEPLEETNLKIISILKLKDFIFITNGEEVLLGDKNFLGDYYLYNYKPKEKVKKCIGVLDYKLFSSTCIGYIRNKIFIEIESKGIVNKKYTLTVFKYQKNKLITLNKYFSIIPNENDNKYFLKEKENTNIGYYNSDKNILYTDENKANIFFKLYKVKDYFKTKRYQVKYSLPLTFYQCCLIILTRM